MNSQHPDITFICNQSSTQPSVNESLRDFMDADYVITGSFHGCVFSILFNKPSVAIGNEERGLNRRFILLGMFKFEERLITNQPSNIVQLIERSIN